ncbi:ABC transporter permease [Acrocarpospora catenulata]|uniref:ABC transporter permease n=1 Tax=Acrocarpospora catenulata TaxID=2836182 RepID=UPI001BDB3DA0|nr:ABC transporter permease [Acrocarpospora catenulata]
MAVQLLVRLSRAVAVVLIVTVAVVSLLSLVPGSAAQVILGESATPGAVAALNAELGLDQPLWQRYVSWLGHAVQGDLGTSLINGQSITAAILERLPVTLNLAVLALAIALLIAIPLAVVSALTAGSRLDRGINALSSMLLSIPTFVAAPVLIYLLAMQLGAFPVAGWVPITEDLAGNLRSALLPALAIAFTEIASFHRILRTDLITTLGEDFVAAARSKGLPLWYVVLRHALRPSSFSLITLVGVNLGRLIGGTVIVETLFSLPGLGQLITSSINARDVVMVQGIVVFMAVAYVGINMLVDLSYSFLDPRVRVAHR